MHFYCRLFIISTSIVPLNELITRRIHLKQKRDNHWNIFVVHIDMETSH